MMDLALIRERVLGALPNAKLERIPNPAPSGQDTLLLAAEGALDVARYLRDEPTLKLDYCSNVTGVDWPQKTLTEKQTVREKNEAGADVEVVNRVERIVGGYLEAVYHLYSMARKHGPVILRMRTANRSEQTALPSLTPVWRSCEFQEREIFDLYGIRFDGHPDLRRLLMWEGFEGYPMRRDYEPPNDEPDSADIDALASGKDAS